MMDVAGEFMQNLPGHNAIVNSIVCNDDGVLVSGGMVVIDRIFLINLK